MTLRKKRFKHRKCMRQFFVFRKINNLMLFLCCCQSLLKTDRVISQMIVMACHQPCRCKRIKQLRIFRIYISRKWCFFVLFSIQIFRKKQTDLIKLCRIKHPADETKCVHLKLRRFYARCLCNFFAVLYCICISGQTGPATVPDKIDMRQISSVCCSMFLYKINCKKDVFTSLLSVFLYQIFIYSDIMHTPAAPDWMQLSIFSS